MTTGGNKDCMTIVVPVFNRPVLVVRCLDSILAQTYRPLHVIVVDNASTDNTLEALSRWKSSNTDNQFEVEILAESRKGAAYARQKGLEHTKTEKVMFFDSDDMMCSDSVESIMSAWNKNPDADMIAWPLAIHRGGDSIKLTHSIRGNLMERHLVHAIFCTLGYAVKTSFIKKSGGWNGEYNKWDDLEVGARLMLNNPVVYSINRPLADVYPQETSITGLNFSDASGGWEHTLDGIERHIRNVAPVNYRKMLNIVSYRRAILAADYAKEGRRDLAVPLYKQALSEVPVMKRPLIRFAYHWTRHHLRGAFSIVGRFL